MEEEQWQWKLKRVTEEDRKLVELDGVKLYLAAIRKWEAMVQMDETSAWREIVKM